jgi:hypothetical protein
VNRRAGQCLQLASRAEQIDADQAVDFAGEEKVSGCAGIKPVWDRE